MGFRFISRSSKIENFKEMGFVPLYSNHLMLHCHKSARNLMGFGTMEEKSDRN